MANRWLFKEEPGHYSFQDLTRDGQTAWEGVRNPAARNHLRNVRKGDQIFYYHTGDVKAVVGIAKAVSAARPDSKSEDEKAVVVDIAPVKALSNPVTLATIKSMPRFKDFPLVRISRLSVMPVTDSEWEAIEDLSRRT